MVGTLANANAETRTNENKSAQGYVKNLAFDAKTNVKTQCKTNVKTQYLKISYQISTVKLCFSIFYHTRLLVDLMILYISHNQLPAGLSISAQ